jgi:hydrogenase maturation protein HypF
MLRALVHDREGEKTEQFQSSPSSTAARMRVQVRGIVQGVGFRPFVHHLAHQLRLAGFVLNTSEGVLIEVEGNPAALEQFKGRLTSEKPPLVEITGVQADSIEPCGDVAFTIRESLGEVDKFVLVSPDVATCDACRSDFTDPTNRRYGYPFTNCTNCGPRYTIIRDIPYDRPATTMAPFRMCAACQAEYDDPANRRFHAQPNACPDCGPNLSLVENSVYVIRGSGLGLTCSAQPESGSQKQQGDFATSIVNSGTIRADSPKANPDPTSKSSDPECRNPNPDILKVRSLLREGKIVAIKGLGGVHLVCDAENDEAVRTLRARKRRSDKPFALMARDLEAAERFCSVSGADRQALLSPQRPIVVLRRRPETKISAVVAPRSNTLGVMLPYTPLHHMLFGDSTDAPPQFNALVMTSGNLSEEPIVHLNEDVGPRLHAVADSFLLHDREIYMRVDDSVVRTFEGREQLLRRSRGYTPHPIDLGIPFREILACGAELKNTFCLTKDRYAVLSQHIGDLENYETLVFFQETLANLQKLFRVEPRLVAYDLHPLYMSTRFALELPDREKIGVQHHHAHIAACMAENGLRGKVIGVALDGTGYGTDHKIWGGEFMLADFAGFERRAHLRYVALPGGDAAVRQPWRMALSYLRDTFGAEAIPADLPLWNEVPPKKAELVQAMLERGIQTVETSSCGRLFDAVSSILGLRQEINFEGQPAIELEMAATEGVEGSYPFEIDCGERWQIDMRPTIQNIVRDFRQAGQGVGEIAARFHNTVAAVIVEVCRRLRKQEHLDRVCLSGGTFQNMFLLKRAAAGLRNCGFEVFLHAKVPPNDGGISLGQALIANAKVSSQSTVNSG